MVPCTPECGFQRYIRPKSVIEGCMGWFSSNHIRGGGGVFRQPIFDGTPHACFQSSTAGSHFKIAWASSMPAPQCTGCQAQILRSCGETRRWEKSPTAGQGWTMLRPLCESEIGRTCELSRPGFRWQPITKLAAHTC